MQQLQSILFATDSHSELLNKLLHLFDQVDATSHTTLANELPLVLLARTTLEEATLSTYLLLSHKVLALAAPASRLAMILHILKVLTPAVYTYNSAQVRKFVLEVFEYFKDEALISDFPHTLSKLALTQVCFFATDMFRAEVSEKLPEGIVSSIAKLFLAGKIREADFYVLVEEQKTLMEWMGFFAVIMELRETLRGTSLGDLIGSLLCQVLGTLLRTGVSSFEEARDFEWVNSIIVYVAAYVENMARKTSHFLKIINKRYIGRYKDSPGFKTALRSQIKLFQSLSLFHKFKFADCLDEEKNETVQLVPSKSILLNKRLKTISTNSGREDSFDPNKAEAADSFRDLSVSAIAVDERNESCAMGNQNSVSNNVGNLELDPLCNNYFINIITFFNSERRRRDQA